LEQLPREPGVYLLKDAQGVVLYVGKAKSLFSRVRSYFTRSGDNRAFVPLLEGRVDEVETIVTSNEKEALLLENTLIKQHRPRFNVMLRDDKSYLVLRLDPRAAYPRLEVTRRIRDDGARYFGPYHSASDCRQTLRLVNRHFQLRTCSDRTLTARKRPCLQHPIERCLAPCVLEVDPAQYARQVEDVTLFLRGQRDELLRSLEDRMERAAAALDFERAARLRDQIAALRSTLQGQQAVSDTLSDQDIIGFHREADRVVLVVLVVREGKIVGRRPFALTEQEFPDEEVLSAFVSRYYDGGGEVPREVLVPLLLDDAVAKGEWLSDLRGAPVKVLAPRRGRRRQLLELASRNARSTFLSRGREAADVEETLNKLKRRLRLNRLPRRIECYDVSSIQGQVVVASMVLMVDGVPDPSGYRRFKITSRATDDFAAMYEVLSRRLRRAAEARWLLPDLLVVDGGKAQLSMALAALRDQGIATREDAPDVVALAKERQDSDGDSGEPSRPGAEPRAAEAQATDRPDRVYLPHVKDPVRLRPNTVELFLLARLRDEAHRFAIAYHRKLRGRQALRSGLDEIPGIGPRRRQSLLRTLGSLKRIREASAEELAAVPGMNARAAETVARYFGSSSHASPPTAARGETPSPDETPPGATQETH
jgi:excinuclease ABC subunit C